MNDTTACNIFCTSLYHNPPSAIAWVTGNTSNPNLSGVIHFYETPFRGILIHAELYGLPDTDSHNPAIYHSEPNPNNPLYSGFFGMHIHEFGDCAPPFDKTGTHYNPGNAAHPAHAGDMLPLLSNNGYAWMAFYDARINLNEILGKSVVIHSMQDDFTSQPAGNSGDKIGCGTIVSYVTD